MGQLQMFRVNIHLLIGILACGGVGLVFLIFFWSALRAWLFSKRQNASERRFRRRNMDQYGRPMPAHAPGICDQCGTVSEKVYYPASGKKYCEKCFDPDKA